ncbi:unnamed protein product, partial [Aphanomyces euteiches]
GLQEVCCYVYVDQKIRETQGQPARIWSLRKARKDSKIRVETLAPGNQRRTGLTQLHPKLYRVCRE